MAPVLRALDRPVDFPHYKGGVWEGQTTSDINLWGSAIIGNEVFEKAKTETVAAFYRNHPNTIGCQKISIPLGTKYICLVKTKSLGVIKVSMNTNLLSGVFLKYEPIRKIETAGLTLPMPPGGVALSAKDVGSFGTPGGNYLAAWKVKDNGATRKW